MISFVHEGCTSKEKQHRTLSPSAGRQRLCTVHTSPGGFSNQLSTGTSAFKKRPGEVTVLRPGAAQTRCEPGMVPAFVMGSVALREEHLTMITFTFILNEPIHRLPATQCVCSYLNKEHLSSF